MFGSDWPVANLRGGYGKVWRETGRTLARLSPGERDRIMGGTAAAFYRLPIAPPTTAAAGAGAT
jgi:L-fuconolactonase